MADTITRAEVVASVPRAWERQYSDLKGPQWSSHQAIMQQLLALPEGFTAEEVNRIIGNESWTSLRCEECGNEVEAVFCFGDTEYASSPSVNVCEVCIRKAGVAVRAAKEGHS